LLITAPISPDPVSLPRRQSGVEELLFIVPVSTVSLNAVAIACVRVLKLYVNKRLPETQVAIKTKVEILSIERLKVV
jgi:hypothetical protein